MKSEDPSDDQQPQDSNIRGKVSRLIRKRVMRRKNAARRIPIHEELAVNNHWNNFPPAENSRTITPNEIVMDGANGPDTFGQRTPPMEIILPTNPSYYRVYCTARQRLLNQQFSNQFVAAGLSPGFQQLCNNGNHLVSILNSFDPLLDDDVKIGPVFIKNIPKVISMGLNVVFEIIKDTYEKNPEICIRSLESLYNLLQGLKPESLKHEPPYMIEKYFDLITSMISLSLSSVSRASMNSFVYENYYSQILELSLLSLITFSIARGDTAKILSCIKVLLIECTVYHHSVADAVVVPSHSHRQRFEIEVPETLILLNRHVCSYLLGKRNIPEWPVYGFPLRSLCETFPIRYVYHQRNLNNVLFSHKAKCHCPTSVTFDGQYLILYRCNRIFLIGSGYNNTLRGHETYSSSIDISNLKMFDLGAENHSDNVNKCCRGGWIGYVNGDLFVQPHSNWHRNHILQLDPRSLKFRNIVPLTEKDGPAAPFTKPTLCTTDGECLILMTVIQDDQFYIRELKPLKLNFEMTGLSHGDEKVAFSMASELKIRLSSVCFAFCGQSGNLNLPYRRPPAGVAPAEDNGAPVPAAGLKLIDTNSYCDLKHVSAVISGKEIALMLTDQGKVYYTGNSHHLGIRHLYSYDKWSLLNIPKPVKIVQIAMGHEGNHALLLGDDGTVFFVGSAKRGEDGESAVRTGCRLSKPSRVKKFSKIDSYSTATYVACNHGTSAIVTKSGELFLFGKDAHHTNTKGVMDSLPKEFQVQSIALGKAHLLILSTKGAVATSGFSNKGQCGFNNHQLGSAPIIGQGQFQKSNNSFFRPESGGEMLLGASLDSRLSDVSGHTFTFGKSRRCTRCLNCTENGIKCLPMNDDMKKYCICGYGNSGCIHCGICSTCANENAYCHANENSIPPEDANGVSKFTTKSLLAGTNFDLESDYDPNTSKMTAISPTILPSFNGHTNPVAQIAAGLHHSVLLTVDGQVYTFGSNQFGQLGVGDLTNRFMPTKVRVDQAVHGEVVQVAAGSNHTVLLTSLGDVITFGSGQNGQLGRSSYNRCPLAYPWYTFPDRMDRIGPRYGRLASLISASGDFTFVKFDEILLSSENFSNTKLMAQKGSLILVPPQPGRGPNSRPEEEDSGQKQKSCKHFICCQNESGPPEPVSGAKNETSSAILIISRADGSCSILNKPPAASHQRCCQKSLPEQANQQIDFKQFSSLFIDSFYQNLWAYNSEVDEFSRFNLMALKTLAKISTIINDNKFGRGHHSDLVPRFPTSLSNMYRLAQLGSPSAHQLIKYQPSAIQPDLSVPLMSSNHCVRKTPHQLALEMMSLLTSLTYSHLFGLSINNKLDQMNMVAKNLSPDEYLSVCRFEDYGGGWGYPPNSVEAIRFSADCDIILGGVGLFGGRGEYNVQIRLFDIGFDGSEVEKDGDLLTETDIIHYECLPRQKYQIFFNEPLMIQSNRWYIVWASITGPSSDCGSNGQAFVCTTDQVMFHFKPSKLSNNGTDVNSGQIPTLFYKQLKPNELFHVQFNNNPMMMMNIPAPLPLSSSALGIEDDGSPFSVSKDFVFKINASCIYSLWEILRHVWNELKTKLFHETMLDEVFGSSATVSFDETKMSDEKFDDLVAQIRQNLYAACFAFELIRAYVQMFLPRNYHHHRQQPSATGPNRCDSGKKFVPNYHFNQVHKFVHCDYDEYKRIANALFEICSLLTAILVNPIHLRGRFQEDSVAGVKCQQNRPGNGLNNNMNNNNNSGINRKQSKTLQQKMSVLIKMRNFFIDECYQTFLACCNAFYPTYALKWSLLCDLLISNHNDDDHGDRQEEPKLVAAMFSNRQLYFLSAVVRSFCCPSIGLTMFFPVLSGSLDDSFRNFENLDDLMMNSDLNVSDLSCLVISKRLAEFYPYGDFYLSKTFTCRLVYRKLLNILVKPLQFEVERFSRAIETMNQPQESLAAAADQPRPVATANGVDGHHLRNYRQFENNPETVAHCELSSSLSSTSSSSSSSSSASSSASTVASSSASSSPSTSSSSSSSTPYDDEFHKSNDNLVDSNGSSTNLSTLPNDTSSWDPNEAENQLFHQNQTIYEQKLIGSSCDLLLKFVAEFIACSRGLINNREPNADAVQSLFVLQNEYSTPSRFCRRSSTKCWETGSGSPEAICFWVNKPDIYISGARVYASTMAQFKYQLQLLDQAFDDEKSGKNPNVKWKVLASVSGIYSAEDNQNSQTKLNDMCDIRFERPVRIQPNIKYAFLFKNFSQYSYSGDMGLAQVRGDDDTVFSFMDCSLSKNGTNLNRGQLPQILYYNVPTIATDNSKTATTGATNVTCFRKNLAHQSVVSMFEMAADGVHQSLVAVVEAITATVHPQNNAGAGSDGVSLSSSNSKNSKNLSSLSTCTDVQVLSLLYRTFDSVFFRHYMPNMMLYINDLSFDPSLARQTMMSICKLIPLLSRLTKMLNDYFGGETSGVRVPNEATQHHVMVESDHPYRPASVTSYMVKFPPTVKFMTIEFDQRCSTVQPEDYLELYIPRDHIKRWNSLDAVRIIANSPAANNKSCTKQDFGFRNLTGIYRRFSGRKDFTECLISSNGTDRKPLATNQIKACANCIFVPGNEVVFMLKTSSDYVHSADAANACYGFKAETIGYEFPFRSTTTAIKTTTTRMQNLDKEAMLYYVKQMVQLFESDLINLSGSCLNLMLNTSPAQILNEFLGGDGSGGGDNANASAQNERDRIKSLLKHIDCNTDVPLFEQIYHENHSLLHKSIDMDRISSGIKTVDDVLTVRPVINPFLDDFIRLQNVQSSGARLALWLQNQPFICPDSCLLTVLNNLDFCCSGCNRILNDTGNNLFTTRKLCGRCHHQLFVKALSQSLTRLNTAATATAATNFINAQIGQKMFLKVVTRDQHQEIAYDPNACIEINVCFVSMFSRDLSQILSDSKSDIQDQLLANSPVLTVISSNPYKVSVKDKTRYHSITMMKAYENYSLEELRLEMHSLLNKKSFTERIKMRSFENGYYLARWTPTVTGCYRIELLVDGEKSDHSQLVNIGHPAATATAANVSVISSQTEDQSNRPKIKLNEQQPATMFGTHRTRYRNHYSMKHSIRKFICSDSAGLRIRALPSLQSEQIGIVAVNGLLTIIDQTENDDGVWVRLSNESIQAYSSNAGGGQEITRPSSSQELFLIDNFESGIGGAGSGSGGPPSAGNSSSSSNSSAQVATMMMAMKQSVTFTLRTEAWALQFNKHFNRTLLAAIDSEDDLMGDHTVLAARLSQSTNIFDTMIIPGWLQVINCGNDGHLVRNWPSLDCLSIIIGIIPIHEVVYAVEIIQNEFGVWVRFSQDSLHQHISALYKSTLFGSGSNIEGWMLAQSGNGVVYLQNVEHNYLSPSGSLFDHRTYDAHNESNSVSSASSVAVAAGITNNNKYDDQMVMVASKKAISNRAAQCIRAVFSAFVWHEGILPDVLTAASFLKFNAEITKDQLVGGGGDSIKRRENGRRQKVNFRHSVEISQLLANWPSSSSAADVNSNVHDTSSTINEKNNIINNNNNNIDLKSECHSDHIIGEKADKSMSTIPEILINLLRIWDFVSHECLQIFNNFNGNNHRNKRNNYRQLSRRRQRPRQRRGQRQSEIPLSIKPPLVVNNNDESDAGIGCPQCESSSVDDPQESLFGQIFPVYGENMDQCECQRPPSPVILKLTTAATEERCRKRFVKIDTIQQLYGTLIDSVEFLLTLSPSNADCCYPAAGTQEDLPGRNLLNELMDVDRFRVVDDHFFPFPLLQHLGMKKSFYEQKVAEEKLSDLNAILSLQRAEDRQHLLSPDVDYCCWPSNAVVANANSFEAEKPMMKKVHRSVSVGMSDPAINSNANIQQQQPQSSFNNRNSFLLQQKSKNWRPPPASRRSHSTTFHCKPSARLMNLMQRFTEQQQQRQQEWSNTEQDDEEEVTIVEEEEEEEEEEEDENTPVVAVSSAISPLMCCDVFRFIFSCYNVEQYRLLVKSCVCSAAYRALGLNLINWLIVNVSNPVSVHDILWFFVYSLLPPENLANESTTATTRNFNEEDSEDNLVKTNTNKLDGNGCQYQQEHYQKDVCRHPFDGLTIGGDSASGWITTGLHRLMKSISKLMPLVPLASPLQRMAVRCLGIDFHSVDHIFLHECKVFSHISAILARSTGLDPANAADQTFGGGFFPENHCKQQFDADVINKSVVQISRDVTGQFEFRASSRQTMVASLRDNSTETFWESGNEDRNKCKHITISKSAAAGPISDQYELKFVCVYIDNTRDLEYRVTHLVFKLCQEKIDSIKYPDLKNIFSTFNEFEKIKICEIDSKFCGWIQCELDPKRHRAIVDDGKYLQIELNGPFQNLRVRQIKLLAGIKIGTENDENEWQKLFHPGNYVQLQTLSCEAETLRVFRLLTSQVFGKLLSAVPNSTSSLATNIQNDKRLSWYQNSNNNENSLREHMVGILFSQSGKLSELQKQVCAHIVREIHLESSRVREEWETMMMMMMMSSSNEAMPSISRDHDDSYCFELLSLVLALSGSGIGCEYLSKQNELLCDMLTLLHASSDRVKRQVLSLIRRVMPKIKPLSFLQLVGLKQPPVVQSDDDDDNDQDSVASTAMSNANYQPIGLLDIFLSCIAKSLDAQIKVKGAPSRLQITCTMASVPGPDPVGRRFRRRRWWWWMKGTFTKQVAHSVISLVKAMVMGQFGREWSEVARQCIVEKITELSQLEEPYRAPECCIQTTTLWLAVASLCVLDEKDTTILSPGSFSRQQIQHDQVNGNSSQFHCDNHDDGETIASIQCNICGNLCSDCDRFLHLNTKTRNHKRHVLKDDFDSIKVDMHEGCGRLKFSWLLVVADSRLLKTMVEFRQSAWRPPGVSGDRPDLDLDRNDAAVHGYVCRFCGLAGSANNICQNEDCQRYAQQVCEKTLMCGHFCPGIANESACMPCLHGCSSELKQDGDDMCMICFSESLLAAPCIQLVCGHVFHSHCVRTVLEKRWSGGRITFTFSLCPICKMAIDHRSLAELLEPIRALYDDVQRKAKMRLEYEGLNKCEAIVTPGARFFCDPVGFAMDRYSYYLCFKCHKAYYGGEARCEADYDENNFNPEELICGSCSDVTQAQICSKHGTDFLEYKCRFCCSVAVYFCFGSTHFCNACHDDFQRLILLKEYPQCPVGPHSIPLDGDECPLHVLHPPTGEEFALGCGICRNAHTF